MTSEEDNVLRFGFRTLLKLVPRSRMGDRALSFVDFIARHRRIPSSKLTLNDLLYRIKTSDEIVHPLRVFVSDKEYVKVYVKAMVGDEYNVPTIAVLRSFDEVKRYQFPADCCIKPTQASGYVILRRDNAPIDLGIIECWFKINYYDIIREANYKTLTPKVIVEPLLFNSTNVMDYKFFCYEGRPKLVQVDVDRHTDHRRDYFDLNWVRQDFSYGYPRSSYALERPGNFDHMIEIAGKMSQNMSLVRVDLYSDGTKIYVGEMTSCHSSARDTFDDSAAEERANRLLFG